MNCETEGIKRGKELAEMSVICKVMYLQSRLSDLSDIPFLLSDLILKLHPHSLADDFWTDSFPALTSA